MNLDTPEKIAAAFRRLRFIERVLNQNTKVTRKGRLIRGENMRLLLEREFIIAALREQGERA